MFLHQDGKKAHIEELKKQRDVELRKVETSDEPNEKKMTLSAKIIANFKKLISEADQSLFLNENLEKR